MPDLKDVTDEITRTARDAAYIAVGLGVLGFQRAQVRRQELLKLIAEPTGQVAERLDGVRGEFSKQVKAVDEAVTQVIDRINASLEPIEDRLPGQARDVVKQVHAFTREAREQLRSVVLRAAA
ncbi:MAG TPA: hypothetical protein VMR97_09035 [Acidimicrobiales bacterium]|nr:hypothetical protein [Acidimicrobiales bacterium]